MTYGAGWLVIAVCLWGCSGEGGTSNGTSGGGSPQSVKSFSAVQQVFTQSCALPSCHSAIGRQGGLVLDHEDISYSSLVDHFSQHEEARDLLRVESGNPAKSFLIRKLRGLGPGGTMPQAGRPLSEETIQMIEDWIARGAHSSAEECGGGGGEATSGLEQVAHLVNGSTGSAICDDQPAPAGDFKWQPERPLEAPPPGEGIQLYTPPRDVMPGSEWETCFAFKPDFSVLQSLIISRQEYRMHEGSHHLLLYMYYGQHPEQFAEGYWPCSAGACLSSDDCPEDSGTAQIPIGGTQVAGTKYVVEYPKGVGLPLLSPNAVLIVNQHYTNPFQPAQPIYGESWLNIYFYRPDEFKVLLDGIFAINARDLIVEPYETKTISRVWHPRGFLDRQPVDAAVFQLFGHMHKRGREFTIDFESGEESTQIYRTTQWDNAPVQGYEPPYLRVSKDDGLRWSCTHENGRRDDPTYPPKKCHPGCDACGWDEASRTCIFTRDGSNRVFQEDEPMPLVFGLLADDDMCNMFGYFIHPEDLAKLEP